MRLTVVVVSLLSLLVSVVASVHRRQIPGFPSCADDCLNNPPTLGGCKQTDEFCLCNSLPFVQGTFACITAACQGTDQQSAIGAAESLCLNFGVTLADKSSAIVAGLSTAGSRSASTTPPGGQGTSAPSPPPTPTNSATGKSILNGPGYVFVIAMALAKVLCGA
ncbi:hypothetical protein C8J57DRAFT_1292525 [Mycena rebaudengoi]|nr:hypothetical protein C8J57DRAFT_1292525 [Mycena rebaudengoi]